MASTKMSNLSLAANSLRRLSLKIAAILYLSIALIVSESSHLVGAIANNNNQQQHENTYLQRPDPNGRPQLMVAIYCGASDLTSSLATAATQTAATLYHNQYLDVESRKWRTDRDMTAFCTQDKQAILNYCKKVYPNHNIRNIVESSRPYKIDRWCKLGSSTKRHCRAKLSVRPYRCLEGTFQSDALLVPERCVFDHVHNKSVCESSDVWNQTATNSCHSKNSMRLQSLGMLQPCGLDVFSGVEFVCCPQQQQQEQQQQHQHQQQQQQPQSQPQAEVHKSSNGAEGNSFAQAATAMVNWSQASAEAEGTNDVKVDDDSSSATKKQQARNDDSSANDDDSEDEEEYEEDEDEYDDDNTSWNNGNNSNNNDDRSPPATTTTTSTTTTTTTTERPIDHYLSHFDVTHEHDEFKKAELAVESSYRDKITKVMREWAQLDGRYEEMKKRDPEAAEDFKKQMTQQFKKTIEALEQEGSAQRHQLASMHAERAMAIINRRKKAAMDCLTQALDRMPIRTRQVERCIVKLLRALEKDRAHTLRQYRNLLNLNTVEALHEKKVILDHLITLNRAANQSIAMLDRSPVLVEKLKSKIINLWHRLRNIPLNEPIVRESELKIMEKYEEEVAQRKIERERKRLAEDEALTSSLSSQQQQHESPSNRDRSSSELKDDGTAANQQQKGPTQEQASSTVVNVSDLTRPVYIPVQSSTIHNQMAESAEAQGLVTRHQTTQPSADGHISTASSTVHSPANNLVAGAGAPSLSNARQTHYQIDSAKFSHLKASDTYHELSYSVKHDPLTDRFKFGSTTLLASACVAMIVLAFVGIKYYGRNSSRAYRRQGFAEVGRSCPDERSVTNMQFNGFENPAYKFFEAAEA